eukprot:CAMPEP_0174257082 /NCGR_PEP_ID=MMETSP0439-20130205/6251_1 /TAXON_ID=0 /ORGANISM="Stereomyxa ramosa, Strain Chinc5" /LENGTH=200 /DNA_ID=CAMNT_0015339997 /DNA_START=11 /DNA_END=613 /DNA_ORIENTATION=-
MGANSVKGLVLMETIYPTKDGLTVFSDPKLSSKLAKEIKKGTIQPPRSSDVIDVDEDLDSKIDEHVRECWMYYDKKGTQVINKKQAQQFFKDCFQLHALRRGMKPKEALGPNVSMKAALDASVRMLDPSGVGQIQEKQFTDFINECDLEEVIGNFTGQTGPRMIDSRLPQNMMFDPSTLPKDGGMKVGEIKYRDYNQTLG